MAGGGGLKVIVEGKSVNWDGAQERFSSPGPLKYREKSHPSKFCII